MENNDSAVSIYTLGGDIQPREFVSPANIKENGPVNNFSFPEQRLQQVPEAENIIEDNFPVQSNGSLQSSMNPVQERISSPVEEPTGEPQKHTYASIVCKSSFTYQHYGLFDCQESRFFLHFPFIQTEPI